MSLIRRHTPSNTRGRSIDTQLAQMGLDKSFDLTARLHIYLLPRSRGQKPKAQNNNIKSHDYK